MPYDSTKPANGAPILSAELRNQFAGLKALIDAQQVQITALQNALAGKSARPTMGEFDPGFSDPPTNADLMAIQGVINELVQ